MLDVSFNNMGFEHDFQLKLLSEKFENYVVSSVVVENPVKRRETFNDINDGILFHKRWIDPGPWKYSIPG